MTVQQTEYDWEAVANAWQNDRPQVLWRSHSDAVNMALLGRWQIPPPFKQAEEPGP